MLEAQRVMRKRCHCYMLHYACMKHIIYSLKSMLLKHERNLKVILHRSAALAITK